MVPVGASVIVHFVQEVPILGTSKRQALFDEAEGWSLAIDRPGDVFISRAASQNVPAIAPFLVHGVGFCLRATDESESRPVPRDEPSAADPVSAGVPGPEATPADTKQAQGRKARAKRLTP
jgi:hypothetical protein